MGKERAISGLNDADDAKMAGDDDSYEFYKEVNEEQERWTSVPEVQRADPDDEQGLKPKIVISPNMPTRQEVEEHEVSHVPPQRSVRILRSGEITGKPTQEAGSRRARRRRKRGSSDDSGF